jgi:hypothetical protein
MLKPLFQPAALLVALFDDGVGPDQDAPRTMKSTLMKTREMAILRYRKRVISA